MHSNLSRAGLLTLPILVVSLSVACSSGTKADVEDTKVTPKSDDDTPGGEPKKDKKGASDTDIPVGAGTTAGPTTPEKTLDSGTAEASTTTDASTTTEAGTRNDAGATSTCLPVGSCVTRSRRLCGEYSSSVATDAKDHEQVCVALAGTYSTSPCTRVGAVGGCAYDSSTPTKCFKETNWYYPPTTAAAARLACKGVFLDP